MKKLLAMFVVVVCCPLSFLGQGSQEKARQTPRIEVRITLAQATIKVGESIDLEVAIENVGESPAFVGRHLSGVRTAKMPYNFEISVHNEKGEAMPRMIVNLECRPFRKENFTREDFLRNVLDDWIALQPGEVFYAKLQFPSDFGGREIKPGRYLVRGRYAASGMAYPTQCNWLALMKEEIKELPYKDFTGTVESNEVWIRVRPK